MNFHLALPVCYYLCFFAHMNNSPIQFSETGVLKPLMSHYLNRNPKIEPFIDRFPSIEAFEEQINIRQKHPVDREGLVAVLNEQYKGNSISELTEKNLLG